MSVADVKVRIAVALERIAAALERFEPLEATEPTLPLCAHPKQEREDFTAMGTGPRWRCRLCGHRENMEGLNV